MLFVTNQMLIVLTVSNAADYQKVGCRIFCQKEIDYVSNFNC